MAGTVGWVSTLCTDHTTRDVFLDIGEEAWSPIILGEECNGVQVATMAAFKGTVGSSD